jgi:hypothetical protein
MLKSADVADPWLVVMKNTVARKRNMLQLLIPGSNEWGLCA